jgi:hypothetical protein
MLKLRGIVAALAAAGMTAFAVACGTALSSGAAPGENDSGVGPDTSIPQEDAGGTDALVGSDANGGADTGSGEGGVPPTGAEFVHVAPDLLDMRLCWQVGSGPFGHVPAFPSGVNAPASNYPALPVGGAVALADASALVGGDINIVGIPANLLYSLENGKPKYCDDMMATRTGGTILNGLEIYSFTIPGGIIPGSTSVIALAGCMPSSLDSAGSVARCGAGYTSATGNLHADVVPLYPVTQSDAGQLPVQAAQLSPALAQLAGDAGVIVSFGTQGATSPVATLAGEGAFGPMSAAYLNVGTNPTNYGSLGFGVDVVGVDGGPGHLWMSLEDSLELVDPTMNPAVYYTVPDTYVVAVVGDPNATHAFTPDASFDGTGLHILVFQL